MTAKSNAFENALLAYIFNSVEIEALGDDLYLALHTADPGESGNQSTSEVAYTNYARVAVPRDDDSAWTVSGNTVVNAVEIAFPECGTTGATATHWSIGTAASGTGMILYKGALTSSRSISSGITPRFDAGELAGSEE